MLEQPIKQDGLFEILTTLLKIQQPPQGCDPGVLLELRNTK